MNKVYDELCCHMMDELSAFSVLFDEEVRKISDFFQCRSVSSGSILWREGDSCDYVAFIGSGRVKVKKETELKGNQVVLGIYGKGSFVGALCILDGSPRAITAEALEDVSLAVITRESFDELMDQYPELGAKILKGMLLSVSKRLKNSFDRLVSIF
jgi:CRP-like cAMP-binding protein